MSRFGMYTLAENQQSCREERGIVRSRAFWRTRASDGSDDATSVFVDLLAG